LLVKLLLSVTSSKNEIHLILNPFLLLNNLSIDSVIK